MIDETIEGREIGMKEMRGGEGEGEYGEIGGSNFSNLSGS